MIWAILEAIFLALLGYYTVRAPAVFFTRTMKKTKTEPKTMMLIFGSGGHTTELLMTFKDYDFKKWKNVIFVKAETDTTSENKIRDYMKTNHVLLNNIMD
jgi:Oligosaccharide biosynthesis protein Alg14 like.